MLVLDKPTKAALVLSLFANWKNIDITSLAEVGVYCGKNAKSLRRLFPEAMLYLIDPWEMTEDYITHGAPPTDSEAEMNSAFMEVLHYFSDDDQTCILRHPSAKASKLISKPLDLVFIDGDHSYGSVRQDIDLWMPRVRPGGILAGHDYDRPSCPDVKRAVDDAFDHGVFIAPDCIWIKIVDG